ncbi:MAG: hypothetical protein LBQ48_03095 [Oscillospiraceae bacterium]|jgi:D-alanyl-lipoteichoic acid acyltransferase DltB (MBOAT superfamily)|nr:hypothetical protein [Oscillospiraceae bacterium]
MLNFSVNEPWFIGLFLIAPFVLRISGRVRKIAFFALSAGLFVLALSSPWQGGITLVFVLLPWVWSRIGKGKWVKLPVILLLVLAFVYLNRYTFMYGFLGVPSLPFKFLGLSYMLFRAIDYLFQYPYLRAHTKAGDILDYINYMFSFYTLSAGPIARFEEFLEDFAAVPEPLEFGRILRLLNRAATGFVKLLFVAEIFHGFAKWGFAGLSGEKNHAVAFLVFAVCNALYIYFNFSGYCDAVIAFAALAGFRLPENFDQPWLARNLAEFWNRWHITLSRWIRDYVYSPLYKFLITSPMKNHLAAARILALFFTFLLAGCWHGATVNYVVYGLTQGLGVAVATIYKSALNKRLGKKKAREFQAKSAVKWIERTICMAYVCLSFTLIGWDMVGLL